MLNEIPTSFAKRFVRIFLKYLPSLSEVFRPNVWPISQGRRPGGTLAQAVK